MINLVGFSPFPLSGLRRAEISPAMRPASGGRPAGQHIPQRPDGTGRAARRATGGEAACSASAPPPVTDPVRPVRSGKGAEGNAAMKEALRFVLDHEGSRYVASDAGKESSKYGILQATAARCGYNGDVRYMSRTEAEAIYRKIWDESGAPEPARPDLRLSISIPI